MPQTSEFEATRPSTLESSASAPRRSLPPRRHKLQRFASPSFSSPIPSPSGLLHFLGSASFGASYKWLVDNPTFVNQSYGWHFQYLTIIGLTVSTVSFICGSLADVTESQTLFKIKNSLSVVAAPMEVLISLLYWGLRLVDKGLVVPEGLDMPVLAGALSHYRLTLMLIEEHIDLGFHAVPSVLMTMDYVLFSPPWRITLRGSLVLTTSIALAYWYWIEVCYKHNGWYPYPLFGQLNTIQRIFLFLASAILMTLSSLGLKMLFHWVNGYEQPKPYKLMKLDAKGLAPTT